MQSGYPNIRAEKAALRTELRQRLAALSPEAQESASATIRQALAQDPFCQQAKSVALFAALPGEPDLLPLAESWRAAGKLTAFPRIEGEQLIFHEITDASDLAPGRSGVREPDPARCPVVESGNLDLVLVPGLAFSLHGWRLGRGGGFYDRWLSQLSPQTRTLGVAVDCQLLPTGPAEIHDEKVQGLCTDTGLQWFHIGLQRLHTSPQKPLVP